MRKVYMFLLVAVLIVALADAVRGRRNYRLTGDTDSSSTVLPESASREDVEILDELASRYVALGDCDAAMHYASKSFELAPVTTKFLSARLSIAHCYAEQGNHSEARTLYEEVRDRASDPELKASALVELAQMDEKEDELFREVVAEYPETEAALDAVGRIAKRRAAATGRPVTAELVSMAEEFAQSGEERQAAVSLYRAAHFYAHEQRYEDFAALCKAVVAQYPESSWAPEALLDTATRYFAQGQWAKVLEASQKILDDYPDSSVRGFAQMNARVMRQFLEIEKKYPR